MTLLSVDQIWTKHTCAQMRALIDRAMTNIYTPYKTPERPCPLQLILIHQFHRIAVDQAKFTGNIQCVCMTFKALPNENVMQ